MDTNPDALNRLMSQIVQSVPEITWATSDDLGRMSLEAFAAQATLGRTQASAGRIRLSGAGVHASSASLDGVGDVMKAWQKLVTALGAAREGFQNLRGRLNAQVVNLTQMNLVASPTPGSVILQFQPQLTPSVELSADGQVPLFGEMEDQLIDGAVSDAFTIMSRISEVGSDTEDGYLGEVSRLGPRVASALRNLAEILGSNAFETDILWEQPGRASKRVNLSAGEAALIGRIISSRSLDRESVEITGVIHTVSDVTVLHVKQNGGEMLTIHTGSLDPTLLREIKLLSQVVVSAEMVAIEHPGGVESIRYTATAIREAGPAAG